MDLNPLLTVEELREVIALQEHLLSLTTGDTDRLDLHQVLADLHRRLVHVQSRHLAAAADVDAWRTEDGRDVLLGRQLLIDVVRNLDRLTTAMTDRSWSRGPAPPAASPSWSTPPGHRDDSLRRSARRRRLGRPRVGPGTGQHQYDRAGHVLAAPAATTWNGPQPVSKGRTANRLARDGPSTGGSGARLRRQAKKRPYASNASSAP